MVSVGLLDSLLTGSFKPYTSVVGDQDRSFSRNQKITTSNLDIYNYGCSILVKKDVVPATNQIFSVRLIVTATIVFHHFDGIAAIERYKIGLGPTKPVQCNKVWN